MQYHPNQKNDEFFEDYNTILTDMNMAFTILFSIEAVLKIMAFGLRVSFLPVSFQPLCELA